MKRFKIVDAKTGELMDMADTAFRGYVSAENAAKAKALVREEEGWRPGSFRLVEVKVAPRKKGFFARLFGR
jgi:hypothetical protein